MMRIVVRKEESLNTEQRLEQQASKVQTKRRITMGGAGAATAAVAAAARSGAERASLPKIGRNDPCWFGSGKKYKQCHMKLDREKADAALAAARAARAAAGADDDADDEESETNEKKKGVSII